MNLLIYKISKCSNIFKSLTSVFCMFFTLVNKKKQKNKKKTNNNNNKTAPWVKRAAAIEKH